MMLLSAMAKPFHQLSEIKRLVAAKSYRIRATAIEGAFELGFGEDDICDCICDCLDETHFVKSMPSEKKQGLTQDVYYIFFEEKPIYLKLQIFEKMAVVISFKTNLSEKFLRSE